MATTITAVKNSAQTDEDLSDEELFQRFRADGDVRAYETLIHRYEQSLFGYLHRYLGSVELAEDVFQATFLLVYTKSDHFEAGRMFRPWLFTIATHKAIDAQRRERRHRHVGHGVHGSAVCEEGSLLDAVPSAGRSPAEEVGDREEWRRMREAVRTLSGVQQRAVQLIYEQGMAYREAAVVMGVPVGTVKSRLHSALLKLNEFWQRSGRSAAGADHG